MPLAFGTERNRHYVSEWRPLTPSNAIDDNDFVATEMEPDVKESEGRRT